MDRPNKDSFMKDLKAISPKLDCYLDYERAKKLGTEPLYVITYPNTALNGEPIIINVVHDGNFGHRYPNKDDLKKLYDSDTHRIPIEDQLRRSAYMMTKFQEEADRKRYEEIRDRTKDNKYQLMNQYNKIVGSGKGAHHVRQITPKTKGYTVKDLRKLNNASNSKE